MKLSVFRNDELLTNFEIDDVHAKKIGNVLFLGRAPDCQIVIPDQQISRQHLKLVKTVSGWDIEKLSEHGGVQLNGSLLSKANLKNGDVLSFNDYKITVVLEAQVLATQENLNDKINTNTKNPSISVNTIPTKAPVETQSLDDFASNENLQDNSIGPNEEDVTILLKETASPEKNASSEEEKETEVSEENGDGFHVSDENKMSENENDKNEDQNDDFLSSTDSSSSENSSETEDAFTTGESTESNFPVETTDSQGSDDSSSDGEKTTFFTTFAKYELSLFGERAPYDHFEIVDNETRIGRSSDKCQIALDDQEVSSIHAVLIKSKVSLVLEDKNSSNGTFYKGKRINRVELSDHDEFIIGSTTFTVKVKSDLLQSENSGLMPVEEDQEIIKEEIVEEEVLSENAEELDFSGAGAQETGKKGLLDKWKKLNPKQKIIYGGLGVVLLFVLLSEEEKPPAPDAATAGKNKKETSKALNPEAAKEAEKNGKNKDDKVANDKLAPKKKEYSPEEKRIYEKSYLLAKEKYKRGEYETALSEIEKVPLDYGEAAQIKDLIGQALKKIKELEEKAKKEEERRIRKKEVEALLEKVKVAVKDRQAIVADAIFSQILEKDPENLDVPQLKMELDAWKKEQERIALEKAQKEAERKRQVDLLSPGKSAYIAKQWHRATMKLDEFLKQKGMDEDLVKEASEMLTESRNALNDIVAPLLGQARSLKEGQDLKGAYQVYAEILKKEPTNSEAISEMNEIRAILEEKAKKLYREAVIAESLSLFDDAKEKYQEVQQSTPSDSDYYRKATERLQKYME